MWIIGLIAAILVLVFAVILSKYGETLLDSEKTFKLFVGGFFVLLVIAGIVMKFTMPEVQGRADISSLKDVITPSNNER